MSSNHIQKDKQIPATTPERRVAAGRALPDLPFPEQSRKAEAREIDHANTETLDWETDTEDLAPPRSRPKVHVPSPELEEIPHSSRRFAASLPFATPDPHIQLSGIRSTIAKSEPQLGSFLDHRDRIGPPTVKEQPRFPTFQTHGFLPPNGVVSPRRGLPTSTVGSTYGSRPARKNGNTASPKPPDLRKEETPWRCLTCSSGFLTINKLIEHQKASTSCPPAAFTRTQLLEYPIVCNLQTCQFRYKSKSALYTHHKTVHERDGLASVPADSDSESTSSDSESTSNSDREVTEGTSESAEIHVQPSITTSIKPLNTATRSHTGTAGRSIHKSKGKGREDPKPPLGNPTKAPRVEKEKRRVDVEESTSRKVQMSAPDVEAQPPLPNFNGISTSFEGDIPGTFVIILKSLQSLAGSMAGELVKDRGQKPFTKDTLKFCNNALIHHLGMIADEAQASEEDFLVFAIRHQALEYIVGKIWSSFGPAIWCKDKRSQTFDQQLVETYTYLRENETLIRSANWRLMTYSSRWQMHCKEHRLRTDEDAFRSIATTLASEFVTCRLQGDLFESLPKKLTRNSAGTALKKLCDGLIDVFQRVLVLKHQAQTGNMHFWYEVSIPDIDELQESNTVCCQDPRFTRWETSRDVTSSKHMVAVVAKEATFSTMQDLGWKSKAPASLARRNDTVKKGEGSGSTSKPLRGKSRGEEEDGSSSAHSPAETAKSRKRKPNFSYKEPESPESSQESSSDQEYKSEGRKRRCIGKKRR